VCFRSPNASSIIHPAVLADIAASISSQQHFCGIVFGQIRILPLVDVVELGKVDFYLSSSHWNSGYTLCTTPCHVRTATVDEYINILNTPFGTQVLSAKKMSGVQLAYQVAPSVESLPATLDSLFGELIHSSVIFSVRLHSIP